MFSEFVLFNLNKLIINLDTRSKSKNIFESKDELMYGVINHILNYNIYVYKLCNFFFCANKFE